MSKITYKQIKTEELLLEEESDKISTGYISDTCEDEGWNLEEIFDLEDGSVIVFVNQIF